MKTTKRAKIILTVLVVLIGIYFGLQYYFNYFINHKLPEIIAEKNDSPYDLAYEDIHYSLAFRSLEIKGISITPKTNFPKTEKAIYRGVLTRLKIQKVDLFKLLKDHTLKASGLLIDSPTITIEQKKDTTPDTKKFTLTNSIAIDLIEVRQAQIVIKDFDTKQETSKIHNLNTVLKGVELNKSNIEKAIPFSYTDCTITLDSLFTTVDKQHRAYIKQLKLKDQQFSTAEIRVKALPDTPTDQVQLDISLRNILVSDIDWSIKQHETLHLQIGKLSLVSSIIAINKKQTMEEQPLKSTLEKKLAITLAIKEIEAKNTAITLNKSIQLTEGDIRIQRVSSNPTKGITVGNLSLNDAKIKHSQNHGEKKLKKNLAKKATLPLVHIDTIQYNNLSYQMIQAKKVQPVLAIERFDGTIAALSFGGEIALFNYKDYSLNAYHLKYSTPKYYNLALDTIGITPQSITLGNFEMKPRMSRANMVKSFRYADDIYTLKVKDIGLKKHTWFIDDQHVFNFSAEQVAFSQVNALIFRDKTPTANPSIKPMFSKMLRDMTFGLQLDEVKILDSKLVYEEMDEKALAPGKLTFTKFNATINNVSSGYNVKKLPDTTLDIAAVFMDNAPLHIRWSFNVLDPVDRFTIAGRINHFSAEAMHPFLHPYVRASTEGMLDQVYFDFYGNNTFSKGKFAIDYKDLKVTLYRKDGKKKKKLLSEIASIFIKKNTNGELKEVSLKEVKRNQDKSFFNYLWLNILQGLKQTIL